MLLTLLAKTNISWSKETVEKCKALNKLATEKDKNSLAVFENGNVKYFSVFSEKIHHNANLSRFVVSYNPKLGTLDCVCCLRKVICTNKAMCIWYLSQYERLANKDLPDLKENTTEFQNQTNTRQSKETYPPRRRRKYFAHNVELSAAVTIKKNFITTEYLLSKMLLNIL